MLWPSHNPPFSTTLKAHNSIYATAIQTYATI